MLNPFIVSFMSTSTPGFINSDNSPDYNYIVNNSSYLNYNWNNFFKNINTTRYTLNH